MSWRWNNYLIPKVYPWTGFSTDLSPLSKDTPWEISVDNLWVALVKDKPCDHLTVDNLSSKNRGDFYM